MATTVASRADPEELELENASEVLRSNARCTAECERRHLSLNVGKVFRRRWSQLGTTVRRLIDLSTDTISHKSTAKSAWDWFIVAATLYTSMIIPFEAAFITSDGARLAGGGDYMKSLAVVDQLVSAVFVVDLILTFRTTFTDERGVTECRPKQIALRYLSGWFFIDVLSILPIDTILFLSDSDKSAYATGLLKTLKLPRLLRVAKKLNSIAINGTAVLSLLIGAFIMCCHWLGCMFYGLAMAERPYLPDPKIGWVDNLAETMYLPINDSDPASGPDIRHRYLASLDFSISCVTNIGLGNTSPNTNLEKIFSIFMMLVGSFLYTAVIRNVNALVAAYGTQGAFRKRLKVLMEFSSFHRLPRILKERLSRSFRNNWSLTHCHRIEDSLRGFPAHLVADVTIYINRAVWKQFSFFEGVNPSCLREVAAQMVTMRIPEGHYILHRGEIVDGVFLIIQGNVTVKHKGACLTTLGPGNAMCQVYDPNRDPTSSYSAFDVVASSNCDLRRITEASMKYFRKYHQDFSERFGEFLRSSFLLRHIASYNRGGDGSNVDDETWPAEAEAILSSLSAGESADAVENGVDDIASPASADCKRIASKSSADHGDSRTAVCCVVRAEALVHEPAEDAEGEIPIDQDDQHHYSNIPDALADVNTSIECPDCKRIGIHYKMDILTEGLNRVESSITKSMDQLRHLLLEGNFI